MYYLTTLCLFIIGSYLTSAFPQGWHPDYQPQDQLNDMNLDIVKTTPVSHNYFNELNSLNNAILSDEDIVDSLLNENLNLVRVIEKICTFYDCQSTKYRRDYMNNDGSMRTIYQVNHNSRKRLSSLFHGIPKFGKRTFSAAFTGIPKFG
ncbi:unnamed protein product [Didymodactylos carnosus]|uniref:Uncharacterized protein n=1 Tax=Didymodactylos carnosus TaxID=1234261 RepID=A0A815FEG8_9BILA|nr:unnamed protein product [Didymodactylos carnosus]CAF1324212.1 unnamed protein product [Didymodactylos carnosus]CAF4126050.1 unnamed protein product [Didymodactylos carnosus]CAF4172636.1 unnamed protein product [Didymodactylos carnosus]